LLEFDKYVEMMKKEKEEVKEEEYTPYEHLRKVAEKSDFYTMDFTIDIDRDILGKKWVF